MKFIINFAAYIVLTGNLNPAKGNRVQNDTTILQNDTTICAGSGLTLSLNLPSQPGTIILSPGSIFEYTFNTPLEGWTTTTGSWSSGNAPFGTENSNSPPDFNYNTYWPPGNAVDSSCLYVRRNIDLTGYDLSTIHWYLGADNGFTLYINGTRVASDFQEGYTYRWEYNDIIPSVLLHPGNNEIALKLDDTGGATAFDMMVEGQPLQPGISILWSTGDTTTTIHVTPAQTTTYYVIVTNGIIATTDSVRVTVNQPSAQLINASICQGESYLGYTTTGIFTDTLIAVNGCDSIRTLTLTVKPKLSSSIIQSICKGQSYSGYAVSGTYIDTLISSNGCDSIRTIHLTVFPVTLPYLGADTLFCNGDSLVLYPGPFNTYNWQDGSTQSHFTVTHPGLYSVITTNDCGSGRDEIRIEAASCDIYFPSAFTPNNDGKNDLFKILGGYNIKEYHLVVYNRWGQKVFETFDYAKGWNGTCNGKLQPSATFVWYCEFIKPGNTKTTMKGTVTLIK